MDNPGLDRIIADIEFERQQTIAVIEQEQQFVQAAVQQIKWKKERTAALQEESTLCKEEVQRLLRQFIANKINCESLRETLKVLTEHELSLTQKLLTLKEKTTEQDLINRQVLQKYREIHREYEAKYKTLTLVAALDEKTEQLMEAEVHLKESRQRLKELQAKYEQARSQLHGTKFRDSTDFIVHFAKKMIELTDVQKLVQQRAGEIKELKIQADAEQRRSLEAQAIREKMAEVAIADLSRQVKGYNYNSVSIHFLASSRQIAAHNNGHKERDVRNCLRSEVAVFHNLNSRGVEAAAARSWRRESAHLTEEESMVCDLNDDCDAYVRTLAAPAGSGVHNIEEDIRKQAVLSQQDGMLHSSQVRVPPRLQLPTTTMKERAYTLHMPARASSVTSQAASGTPTPRIDFALFNTPKVRLPQSSPSEVRTTNAMPLMQTPLATIDERQTPGAVKGVNSVSIDKPSGGLGKTSLIQLEDPRLYSPRPSAKQGEAKGTERSPTGPGANLRSDLRHGTSSISTGGRRKEICISMPDLKRHKALEKNHEISSRDPRAELLKSTTSSISSFGLHSRSAGQAFGFESPAVPPASQNGSAKRPESVSGAGMSAFTLFDSAPSSQTDRTDGSSTFAFSFSGDSDEQETCASVFNFF